MKMMRLGRMPRVVFWGMALLGLLATSSWAQSNTPPTPVIVSAAMREGTTLMDVVYRVDDPDDAAVSAYPLAFVDGVRSFSNVLRVVTFEEGTETNFGASVAANVDHTLVWNVAADWDIDLGQVKFEIICKDSRGMLPFDWVTIPATAESEEVTISLNSPTDAEVLDALFWMYANGDPWLQIYDGILKGTAASGAFNNGVSLVTGNSIQIYAAPIVLKRMNLAVADKTAWAMNKARAGIFNSQKWYAENRPYDGLMFVVGWGDNIFGQVSIPAGLKDVRTIAGGVTHSLALKSDGTVVGWGYNNKGQVSAPAGLSDVTEIAAGSYHNLAMKSDGTVVGWGCNDDGEIDIPAGLSEVVAIEAGAKHSLALKSDGTVVGWGSNNSGQLNIPAGLTNVTAIAAGGYYNLALKSDGTVVGWGNNASGQINIPAGLSDVTAIAAGSYHSLALKNNGTVVGWGRNNEGQVSAPAGLTGVTAIATGDFHSLALKSDGTVVGWGDSYYGAINSPAGLTNVTAIAAGNTQSLALTQKAE